MQNTASISLFTGIPKVPVQNGNKTVNLLCFKFISFFPKTRLSERLGFKLGLHLSSLHQLLSNSSMAIPLTVFMWVVTTWHQVLKVPSSWLRYPGIYTILAFAGLIGIPNLTWSKKILTHEIIQISFSALTHVDKSHCYSKQSPSVALGLCLCSVFQFRCQKTLLLFRARISLSDAIFSSTPATSMASSHTSLYMIPGSASFHVVLVATNWILPSSSRKSFFCTLNEFQTLANMQRFFFSCFLSGSLIRSLNSCSPHWFLVAATQPSNVPNSLYPNRNAHGSFTRVTAL